MGLFAARSTISAATHRRHGAISRALRDAGCSAWRWSRPRRVGVFAEPRDYEDICVPFLKRAQIAAADLARAGVTLPRPRRLTMFADNLVPHVLRLDGILSFDPLLRRSDRARGADRARLPGGDRDPRLRRYRSS